MSKQVSNTFTVSTIEQGERGQIGRFPYYSGVEFDSTDNNVQYVINDVQAPYFKVTQNGQERYYVFNPELNGETFFTMEQMWDYCENEQGEKSFNNYPWEIMTNDFYYLITKALFAAFAHLGDFIVNGRLLHSQQVKWLGTEERVQDGSESIESRLLKVSGGSISFSGTTTTTLISLVNFDNVTESSVALFEDSYSATNVNEHVIYSDTFRKGMVYRLEYDLVEYCGIYLRYNNDSSTDIAIGTSIFEVEEDVYLTVVAVPVSTVVRYKNLGLYMKFFSPNVVIDGQTGKASYNDVTANGTIKGTGDFTTINVSTNSNLQGTTRLHQPIILADRDNGSTVPSIDSLPQIPNVKYVEVVGKDAQGNDVPISTGKLVIDSNGYLKYNKINDIT